MGVLQLSQNQIIQYFIQLAAQNERINTFGFGPIYDLGRDTTMYQRVVAPNSNMVPTGELVYPLMWVEPIPNTLRKDSIILRHKIHIIDLVEKELSNRMDVLSDSLRTCMELKAYIFKDFFYDIFPSDTSELTPIFEKYDDETTGYIMDLELQLDWLADVCNIPGMYPSGATFVSGPTFYNVQLGSYLPLAGGTLTGPLSGTSADFFTYYSAGTPLETIIYNIADGTTGLTHDFYTTGATLVGDTIFFDRNDLLSAYTVDLSSITGGTGGGFSGWTSSTGVFSIIQNNSSGNIAGDWSIAGGQNNQATGTNAFIGNGYTNIAQGYYSVVAGGSANHAIGSGSIVGGGNQNHSEGTYSSVLGGSENTATNTASSVLGGRQNTITGTYSVAGAGLGNNISGNKSIIGTGKLNVITSDYSAILNGNSNSATTQYSTVLGGAQNLAAGPYNFGSTIVGGNLNKAYGSGSIILAGTYNTTSGSTGIIGNGQRNFTYGSNATVLNGNKNYATNYNAVVIGGFNNRATGYHSFIGNGFAGHLVFGLYNNKASSTHSFIGNGYRNSADTSNYTTVLNGKYNQSSGYYSTVLNGKNNTVTNTYGLVLQGYQNIATGVKSSIINGSFNNISSDYSTIIGGSQNIVTGNSAFIGGGSQNKAAGQGSSIVAGYQNFVNGIFSIVGGGQNNSASTTHSSVLGGVQNLASGSRSTVGGGRQNQALGSYSTVPGGRLNIALGSGSAILGGTSNKASSTSTVILAFDAFTGSSANTVFVPTLSIQSATTNNALTNILVLEPNGEVRLRTVGSLTGGATVNNGTNTFTGGTSLFQSVNITGGTVNNWNITGGTLSSGGTNLYSIFQTTADGNDITRVQPGSNITTGGTGNLPTVSVVASPSFASITSSGASSFTTLTATTFISGSTNLYNIFSQTDTNDITRVQPGINTYTGGTGNNPTINISAGTFDHVYVSGYSTFVSISGTSVSASTVQIDNYLKINTGTTNITNPERILINDGVNNSFANVIVGRSTAAQYAQLNIQNESGGTGSSSDIVATADNGTESTFFVDMGINSSTFNGSIGVANDAYLYSQANDLWLGNNTSNKNVNIFTDISTNAGIRINVTSGRTTFSTPISATTISAATIYSNLISATTISATTYYGVPDTFGNVSDGVGGVLATGVTGYRVMTTSGTITGWNIISNLTGNVVFDIWKMSGGTVLPTVSNTIVGAGTNPQLTGALFSASTAISTWTKTFNNNDVFAFNINSVTGITWATLTISYIKN